MTVKITVSRVLLAVGCCWCCVNSLPSPDSSSVHCAVAAPGYLLVWLQYPCRATAWGSTTTPRGHRVKTVNSRGCPVSTVQCWWWDVNQAYDSLVTPGPGPQQGHRWYCSSDVYTEVTISLAPSTMLSLSLSPTTLPPPSPWCPHRVPSGDRDTRLSDGCGQAALCCHAASWHRDLWHDGSLVTSGQTEYEYSSGQFQVLLTFFFWQILCL